MFRYESGQNKRNVLSRSEKVSVVRIGQQQTGVMHNCDNRDLRPLGLFQYMFRFDAVKDDEIVTGKTACLGLELKPRRMAVPATKTEIRREHKRIVLVDTGGYEYVRLDSDGIQQVHDGRKNLGMHSIVFNNGAFHIMILSPSTVSSFDVEFYTVACLPFPGTKAAAAEIDHPLQHGYGQLILAPESHPSRF